MLKDLLPLDPLRLMGIKAATLINESELNKLQGFFSKNSATKKGPSKFDIAGVSDKKRTSLSESLKKSTPSPNQKASPISEGDENSKKLDKMIIIDEDSNEDSFNKFGKDDSKRSNTKKTIVTRKPDDDDIQEIDSNVG